MQIPLAIFYFLYLALVAVYVLYTIFNIYHLLRFASPSPLNLAIVLLYLAISAVIVWLSWQYVGAIDWSGNLILPGPNDAIFP